MTVILSESFNEETQEFITEEIVLELEHSLVALSKWESEWQKPFLGPKEKSTQEVLSYIWYMNLTPNVSPEILDKMSEENFQQIHQYIDSKMTATWFHETKPQKSSTEQITSEYIYYWMVSYQIPWNAERWHLNRLLTLIQIFNVKNSKPQKMSRNEMLAQRKALNDKRRAELQSKG